MTEMTFDNRDAAPEGLREFGTEKDGKFVVAVAPKVKLDEFRTNNLNLSKERDSLQTIVGRFRTDAGFDPEKMDEFFTQLGELKTTAQLVADGKLVKDTSLDEAVSKRTNSMRSEFENQINALKTANQNFESENKTLKQEVANGVIDRAVTAAATDEKSGVRSDALNAVIREAREFFRVEDGKLVARDKDNQIVYGADGATPITPMEWLKTKLISTAPYLYRESQGGGAGGSGGGSGTLTAAQLQAMSPEQKMEYARAQR